MPNRRMMPKCRMRDLRSFALNNVMTKNPRIPANARALPLKQIYSIKRDLKGNIVRYKARLVVQGFFQIYGIDYTDTYSPVAKFVSIRMISRESVQLGLITHQMGVNTASLKATLDEDIWVKIPAGTTLATGDDDIYKLIQSLYGLKLRII